MQRSVLFSVLLAISALAVSAPATAVTTQVFGNLAVFQANTGATDATGPLPSPGVLGSYSASFSSAGVGSVTFAAPSMVFTEWSTLLPGAELAISVGAGQVGGGVNDGLDAHFAAPVFAAGFDFHQPTAAVLIDGCNVSPCVDSQFQVQLKNGTSVVATLAWTPLKDQRDFWGVWSDTPFDRLEIRETVGTDDNEFYGRFYTGVTPVPEPGSTALWMLGLLTLGAAGARRRR